MRFHCFNESTVVRYSLAMEKSVSPLLTRCVTVVGLTLSTAGGSTLLAVTTSAERAGRGSAIGAGLSVRAASSVVVARGMMSCWPALSDAFVDR